MHSVHTANTYVVSVKFDFIWAATHSTPLGLCTRLGVVPGYAFSSFTTVAPGIITLRWHAWSSFPSRFSSTRPGTAGRLRLFRWQLFTTPIPVRCVISRLWLSRQWLFATATCGTPRVTTGIRTGSADRKANSFTRFAQKQITLRASYGTVISFSWTRPIRKTFTTWHADCIHNVDITIQKWRLMLPDSLLTYVTDRVKLNLHFVSRFQNKSYADLK